MLTRRQLLAMTSLTGLGIAAGLGAARAFQITEPTERIETLYSLRGAACRTDEGAYHQQLIDDLRSALEGSTLSEDEKIETVASLVCPSCGCRVKAG